MNVYLWLFVLSRSFEGSVMVTAYREGPAIAMKVTVDSMTCAFKLTTLLYQNLLSAQSNMLILRESDKQLPWNEWGEKSWSYSEAHVDRYLQVYRLHFS